MWRREEKVCTAWVNVIKKRIFHSKIVESYKRMMEIQMAEVQLRKYNNQDI